MIKLKSLLVLAALLLTLLIAPSREAHCGEYDDSVHKLANWLASHRDPATGLPHSHVGDKRFTNWAITYDSAVTSLAYLSVGKSKDAKRIIDFYLNTPKAWRLGGIIEAVEPTGRMAIGADWSVRTGSNVWIGIAAFHLYRSTADKKYLALAVKQADFAAALQNIDIKDANFGGIRLGPEGDKNFPNDQRLGYDLNQPRFFDIYATEHNIDAFALFSMVYGETKNIKYRAAMRKTFAWLNNVGYNRQAHRLNRGSREGAGIDRAVASDIHAWIVSALGVKKMDFLEPGSAEMMLDFIERHCMAELVHAKEDGRRVTVRGVDFVDYQTASELGRKPMISPEWTFQLINAYRRLEADIAARKDLLTAERYRQKRLALIESMRSLAVESKNTLAYPYATQPEALIGHEYRTPAEGNLSAIGAAYGILALTGFDPLRLSFID